MADLTTVLLFHDPKDNSCCYTFARFNNPDTRQIIYPAIGSIRIFNIKTPIKTYSEYLAEKQSVSTSSIAEAWLLNTCKQAYEILPKWKAAGIVSLSDDGVYFNFHRVKQNAIGQRLFKLGFQSWTDAEKHIQVEDKKVNEKSLRAYADPQKPAKTYWEFETAEVK
jgi:hypothetical protein